MTIYENPSGSAKREYIVVERSRFLFEARMVWFGTFQMSQTEIFARHQPGAPYSTRSETREYNHDFPAEGVPNVVKNLNTQLHLV